MDLNPLSLLEKAINEHGSSTILKERIELVKDLLLKVQRDNELLLSELATTKRELAELKKKIPREGFVEYRGVKFKRRPSGGYETSVYCPSCEVGMATISGADMPFVCGKCHSLSGFNSNELPTILKDLIADYPA